MKLQHLACALLVIFALSAKTTLAQEKAKPKAKKPRVIAALISVCTEKDARRFKNTENVDLIKLNGKPMIWWVYQGLKNCAAIDKIIVVGPDESYKATGADPKKDNVQFIQSDEEAVIKLMTVMDNVNKNDIVINIPSDLTLVTPDELGKLLDLVRKKPGGDYYLFMIKAEAFKLKYPKKRCVDFKFLEGKFTPAHVQVLIPAFFKKDKKQAVKVYRLRRSPIGMIKLLGGKLIGRYLRGRLSFKDMEARAVKQANVKMKITIVDNPDYAADLQRPKQIPIIEKELKEKAKLKLTPQPKNGAAKKTTPKPDEK